MDGKSPKYYQLKNIILRKVQEEEYPEGSLMESERELMDQYKMSRITVRKAIEELVNEGYLYRIQGKGTYVKGDTESHNLFNFSSCTDDVKRMGRKPSKRTIDFSLLPSDPKNAKNLNIPTGENMYSLARVTYADEEPLNYTVTHLAEKNFPKLLQYDFTKQSLYDVLKKDYGVSICKAKRTIEAVLPTEEVAKYLEIGNNMPVILFRCTTYGILNGRESPIENFRCYYRTDHYKFYIDQVKGS